MKKLLLLFILTSGVLLSQTILTQRINFKPYSKTSGDYNYYTNRDTVETAWISFGSGIIQAVFYTTDSVNATIRIFKKPYYAPSNLPDNAYESNLNSQTSTYATSWLEFPEQPLKVLEPIQYKFRIIFNNSGNVYKRKSTAKYYLFVTKATSLPTQ